MRALSRLAATVLFAAASCAASPWAGRGTLPPEWERVRDQGDTVAFHHPGGGTIVRARSCADGDDVPLDVLTNHLLLGIENRRERARQPLIVDGRAALRTELEATLDGVPVALDLVVLKKDGCTLDVYLVAPPADFAARRADFDRYVAASFQVSRR